MSMQEIIFREIEQIAHEEGKACPHLSLSMRLLDIGIESLGMAKLTIRLEDLTGFDPFSAGDEFSFPVTLGELVSLYENADATLRSAADSQL